MKSSSRLAFLALFLTISSQALGQSMPVPDTIRAEGIPPVPAAVGQALSRYQNIRAATFQDWSSDGEGMYIVTRFADVPQVHFIVQPGGARTQLTFLPERILGVSARPGHDQFLYMIDEGGAENYQLFLQDRRSGQARRVTDGKSRNMAPKWSPSGELLAWSNNSRNGRDMDIYVGAPTDAHFVRRLKEVSGQWTVSDWSPDETKVVAVEEISINESYIHVIEIATGKTETITPRPSDPKAERIAAQSPKWSPDGKSLFYLTDRGGEYQELVRYDLASGATRSLTATIHWDVEEFDIHEAGQHIGFVTNENGVSKVHAIEIETGNNYPEDFVKLGKGQISGFKFRPGTQQAAVTFSSSSSSSDVYEISPFSPAEHERWTSSELGGLDATAFVEPELIEYSSFDGRKIPAFLYRPLAVKFPGPRPVLINIHGGPEGQFRPGFLGRLNYLISELGIALVFPNVRGSSGYGKTYLKLDNGMKREDSVKDIGALLDWIAGNKDLDKSRVGVTGGSYGGFMSLAVQTSYNNRIKAGIDIVGISNFVTFLKNTQGYRRDLRRVEYGDERQPEMNSFLERVSPLSRAHMIHTPILVVQGQNDPRVPLSEADQMVAALKKNEIPLWYMVGKNEGHGFAKKVNQDYLQAVEVMFLRRYLLGESASEK